MIFKNTQNIFLKFSMYGEKLITFNIIKNWREKILRQFIAPGLGSETNISNKDPFPDPGRQN
jgi:hypothetical protein